MWKLFIFITIITMLGCSSDDSSSESIILTLDTSLTSLASSLDSCYYKETTENENIELTISSSITLITDSDNDLNNGDEVKIEFVNYKCHYIFDGTNFLFSTCDDNLSESQPGDKIKLIDLRIPAFPSKNGRIQFGLYRNGSCEDTQFSGTIKVQVELN